MRRTGLFSVTVIVFCQLLQLCWSVKLYSIQDGKRGKGKHVLPACKACNAVVKLKAKQYPPFPFNRQLFKYAVVS